MQRFALVAVLVGSCVLLAACGGGDSSVSSSKRSNEAPTTEPSTTTSTAPKATVQVADSMYGPIVVDGSGLTLYLLDTDTSTTVSCTDACAGTWPPLIVKGSPVAGSGVDASMLSTLATPAGTQVLYAGHPLYRFSGDQAPGQTNGFGVGGVWWVIAADGTKVAPPPPATQPPAAPAATAPPTEAPPPPPSYTPPSYKY